MAEWSDKELGLDRPIARRNFIGGIAVTAAAGALLPTSVQALAAPSNAGTTPAPDHSKYPPIRTGLRGQYPGSFEVAHEARDGGFSGDIPADDSGEHYDLVIVGGGISGLSSAYFYRQALGDDRKILILDNHDDFGGHAKRNEFNLNGRTILSYGGTMSIESPFPYSFTSKKLVADLGIDLASYERYEVGSTYAGLASGTFFDKEHFLADKVVTGTGQKPWDQFFREAPLSAKVRADLTRLFTDKVDYMPGLTAEARVEALRKMSYQDFLLNHAKLLPESLPYFTGAGYRNNKRVDTVPAYEAASQRNAAGFAGMAIPGQIRARAQHFHWPDGNATIARLLVNRLIPGAFQGVHDQESIVLAPCHYAGLDNPANSTRLRLSAMVIRAEHIGKTTLNTEKAVRLVYVKDGKRVSVTAANVIMGCFNNIIPFVVPTLPEDQKTALGYASKVPIQYTNVLVRNWHAWKKLGVKSIHAPNGYHPNTSLDIPMKIGGYSSAMDPSEPIVIHMTRNPNAPGLPRKDQNRAGRMSMLTTDYPTIEREIRSQLQRMLGGAGFDAARDIAAITANRWPHGYAYTYDSLADPDMPDEHRPHILGRRTFGRIAIANSDSGAAAFTNAAIDAADRAVTECLISRGLT